MEHSVRVVWEQFASTGVAPTISVDTDNESPPRFSNLVSKLVREMEIGPSVADQALVLSEASCSFLLVSDEPVIVNLKSGETDLRARMLLLAAEDETGAALPAQTVLLSGNGSTTAKVQVFALSKVS